MPDTHVLDHLDGVKLSRHQGEAMTFCGKLEDNSQDVVFLLDVLEHLPKHSGWMMLYEINRIARYGIGVTVPNGFDWQPPSPDNPFQAHISSWSYKDFKLGKMSKILGTHGIKALTSQYATKKYGLRALTYPLYFFEVVIGRLFPRISAKIWAENAGESMLTLSDVETATDKIL